MSVSRSGQRAVDVDRDRPDLVDGEELLEAVDHPLGPPQAEGRDHDLALEPDGPRDDRVELLDQLVVRVELAVAVGALGDQDVDVLDDRRVGQEAHVPAAEVAGEDEPAVAAVLAVVELDHGRAEDVAGVEVGQRDARDDLGRRRGTGRAGAARRPTRRRPARRGARPARACGCLRWALRSSSRWIRALSRSITLMMSPVARVVKIGPV